MDANGQQIIPAIRKDGPSISFTRQRGTPQPVVGGGVGSTPTNHFTSLTRDADHSMTLPFIEYNFIFRNRTKRVSF